MSTPITEKEQFSFPAFEPDVPARSRDGRDVSADVAPHETTRKSSDEDGTLHNSSDEVHDEHINGNHLKLKTSYDHGNDFLHVPGQDMRSPMSPADRREQSLRLDDDLEMLRVERVISEAALTQQDSADHMGRSRSMNRSRSRNAPEPADDFDIDTTPLHEKAKIYQPPAHPASKAAKLFKRIHESVWLVRYMCYITPLTLLLLIPLLLGALVFPNTTVGGVELLWFSIWLEIVWLTLWAGRILAKCIPWPMGVIASIFTNNSKKWRDLGKALEVPATLFFWWLAIEISFLPCMVNHHLDGNTATRNWETIVNKIIIAFFVGATLNFFEKIIIQLIAISFHLRTYADRIELNKFQIGSLVKLYRYSKEKIEMDDSDFEVSKTGKSSGQRTPMAYVNKAGKTAQKALKGVTDVAGKVAGDFTGKQVTGSKHPHQVVLALLRTTSGSQLLARRLYRTYTPEESETALADDLRPAFDNDEEADAAFTMFDRDLNGDISMEELEGVCVEIGRERKAITASLKDLDSVVSKLDDVFVFIVAVITILVFISIISTSAQAAITSAGSAVLALSWLFSATAQEFLQSIIFVFVKHPFDVGDRVTVYGNTGSLGRSDDYFVKEVALLYTEFKKMEGHVVQAPNSYLNTLFILNQRRSGGLAEAVPIVVKFGTTLEQIEGLRTKLLEFVTSENREYQQNILIEVTTVTEAYSISLNTVFFYKSNWQNELLRLQRRNKYICALMCVMQELGIEGPRQKLAGQSPEQPMYLHGAFPPSYQATETGRDHRDDSVRPGPRSGSLARDQPFVPGADEKQYHQPMQTHASILRKRGDSTFNRGRSESVSQMAKRVDFSLGMSGISSGDEMGDVYDKPKPRIPIIQQTSPSPQPTARRSSHDTDNGSLAHSSSLNRITSNGSSTTTHRNRFFSRTRSKLSSTREADELNDLEAGTFVRRGTMPDIPETSGQNTSSTYEMGDISNNKELEGRMMPSSREPIGGRIDPRTGIISPQAVVSDSAAERGDLPMAAGARRSLDR